LSTLRGCPPRWVCGGGISGAKIPHCSSVRSEGYGFRYCPSIDKYALLHWGSMRQLSPNSCFLPSPVSGEPLSDDAHGPQLTVYVPPIDWTPPASELFQPAAFTL